MLKELQDLLAKLLGEIEALAEKGGEDFDNKLLEIKGVEEKIGRFKSVEQLKAASATPLNLAGNPQPAPEVKAATPTVPASPATPLVKGANIARLVMSLAASKGNVREAADFSQKTWGTSADPVTKNLLVSVGSAGGFMVPMDFRDELIELLRPASVVMRAGPRVLDMPRGNMTIPGLAAGAQASYVGETQPIPPSTQTYRAVSLTAKKIASLIPISNDFLRYPTASTDAFVRDDMIAAMSSRADLAFMRSEGTEYTPKGLRGWAQDVAATNVFVANASPTLQNVKNDLGKMELAIESANVMQVKPVWFMSPRSKMFLLNFVDGNGNAAFPEVANGNLRGKPIFTTTAQPDNLGGGSESEIFLVEMNEFIIGESMALELAVADGAAYWDGAEVKSAFSQDQTVMRALAAHDTAMRQPRAVAMLTTVTWTS